jgi:hypothetical protein
MKLTSGKSCLVRHWVEPQQVDASSAKAPNSPKPCLGLTQEALWFGCRAIVEGFVTTVVRGKELGNVAPSDGRRGGEGSRSAKGIALGVRARIEQSIVFP